MDKVQPTRGIPYEQLLHEELADLNEAALYLNACLEDPDPRVALLAIRDIAASQGGVGKLAKASGLNRESLYRMLSLEGNPSLLSLVAVLRGLGFRLTVEPAGPVKAKPRATVSRRMRRAS